MALPPVIFVTESRKCGVMGIYSVPVNMRLTICVLGAL